MRRAIWWSFSGRSTKWLHRSLWSERFQKWRIQNVWPHACCISSETYPKSYLESSLRIMPPNHTSHATRFPDTGILGNSQIYVDLWWISSEPNVDGKHMFFDMLVIHSSAALNIEFLTLLWLNPSKPNDVLRHDSRLQFSRSSIFRIWPTLGSQCCRNVLGLASTSFTFTCSFF